jgi:predicted N-acetyltransferase YhbS
MRSATAKQRVGLQYLATVTTLLQRIRASHPTKGLYEAADLQWWWRSPRSTDDIPQSFWVDPQGIPVAAAIATDWGKQTALDFFFMPDAGSAWKSTVVGRGLEHAADVGLGSIQIEADPADEGLLEALLSNGFTVSGDGYVESWIDASSRSGPSSLHGGYRLVHRAEMSDRPHHMIKRSQLDVESRLRQTSLYRPDLDLMILDEHEKVAAYALFWYDPTTETGLVEPMRTEQEHQRLGLARHLLTSGVDRLAKAGAERIKIVFDPENPASSSLYLDVGFQPVRQTIVLTGSG